MFSFLGYAAPPARSPFYLALFPVEWTTTSTRKDSCVLPTDPSHVVASVLLHLYGD